MAVPSSMRSKAAVLSNPLITSDTELAQRVGHDGAMALDTEFIRTDTFFPIPALYQLATDSHLALVDATAELTFASLKEALLDTERTIVMHACSEDLEVLRHHLGVLPGRLVDTQLAHAFIKAEFSKSYASLVESHLGVVLDKEETRSDWLRRPLSDKQLAYARNDVVHLLPLWDAISEGLDALDRVSWFEDEMRRLTTSPVGPDEYFRVIKGAWRLAPTELKTLSTWPVGASGKRAGAMFRARVPSVMSIS